MLFRLKRYRLRRSRRLICSESTVTEHLLLHQKELPMATGPFTRLLNELILAAKIISREVNKAGLVDILGFTGEINVQGEEVASWMNSPTGFSSTGWKGPGFYAPWPPRKTPT